jgi:hypothetical protein
MSDGDVQAVSYDTGSASKRDQAVDKRQAAMTIQARQRAAKRKQERREANVASGEMERPFVSNVTGGGFEGTDRRSTGQGAEEAAQSSPLEIQKRMHAERQHLKEAADAKAAAQEAKLAPAKPAELHAAEVIQARWRWHQYRRGKLKSPYPKARVEGGKAGGSPKAGRKKKTAAEAAAEREEERAAAMIQARVRGTAARQRAGGKKAGAASYAAGLKSESQQRQEQQDAMGKAATVVARFYTRFCRKRNARRWVREELERQNAAASKVQAAQRGKRIRKLIGYRGETEGELGRPHGAHRCWPSCPTPQHLPSPSPPLRPLLSHPPSLPFLAGRGRMIWPDCSCYDGEWVDGLMEGRGELIRPDGSHYNGAWKSGKWHGRGEHMDVNGDVHDGEWRAGVAHGPGTLTKLNGSLYVGEWQGED